MEKGKIIEHVRLKLLEKENVLLDQEAIIMSSMEEETKSSVGDKYETTRALLHAELDKVAVRRSSIQETKKTLSLITNTECQHVTFGALVETNLGVFLIGPSIGKINVENKAIMCISVKAPIARAMWEKGIGSTISFKQRLIEIVAVC